ncbi:hypothetical protein [Amycolatopsis azurea]|uniref:Uncharacterized protein n=1 Tax=Amycolatopsis azurea DSM 43854 TaxID=1238180 RepID=M2QA84_9PSEU|nr:hypothetical protein [Amycolatopsis azurea]EMD22957.1 hypothetical protein C791_7839 [Amycolatopsis azurea DSM 43854]
MSDDHLDDSLKPFSINGKPPPARSRSLGAVFAPLAGSALLEHADRI